VALGCFLLVWGCASEHEGPNVVLISIDTLRPDHLSVYGYERPTATALEGLAEEGVVFLNAYSTSSWTAPAVASLLTSLRPDQHHVRSGSAPDFLRGGKKVVRQEVLDGSFLTLAEILEKHGYVNFGFSTNPHVSAELGFAQGFGHFESLVVADPDPARGKVYADARATTTHVSSLLPRMRESGRFLLWIHYLDPHFPYRGRSPWVDRYKPTASDPDGLPEAVIHPHWFGQHARTEETRKQLFTAFYDSRSTSPWSRSPCCSTSCAGTTIRCT
jgi:arylsulfatase A-like enzyme